MVSNLLPAKNAEIFTSMFSSFGLSRIASIVHENIKTENQKKCLKKKHSESSMSKFKAHQIDKISLDALCYSGKQSLVKTGDSPPGEKSPLDANTTEKAFRNCFAESEFID